MGYKITLIPGDGIGPEIVREARKVLDAVGKKYGHEFPAACRTSSLWASPAATMATRRWSSALGCG